MEAVNFLTRPFLCPGAQSQVVLNTKSRSQRGAVTTMALQVVLNTKSRSQRGAVTTMALQMNSSACKGVPNSNYVVPLDKSSCITRPLNEILRDLNKKVPEKIVRTEDNCIPWFHANRMLSFYAPGWCGEIRDVIFSDNGGVTVVYRVTIHGSDGEAHRESTGTVLLGSEKNEDPVSAAEEIAFCKACARFGLGLYLYHEDDTI